MILSSSILCITAITMRQYFSFSIFSIFLCFSLVAAHQNCFTSIFSFGDSLSDNGNLVAMEAPKTIHQGCLPNGETYFGHPTGRCCDGRLIVDLLAQSLGLPIPPPSIPMMKKNRSENYAGVNFAVAGARALNSSFYYDRGIEVFTNASLKVQLDWFKDLLPSLCDTKADCLRYLQSSLMYIEIGGNDYSHAFLYGRSMEEVITFVPLVVEEISSAITNMIELGGITFLVPGSVPLGCMTYNVLKNKDNNYDESGCIKSLNHFIMYHNDLLQTELDNLRKLHPHVNIIYADFYNSSMRFFRSPRQFGFIDDALTVCCGAKGHYNYNLNLSVDCGDPETTSCNDPSKYIIWDGRHFTEAANKLIVQSLLEGPYSIPPLKSVCPSQFADENHSFSY